MKAIIPQKDKTVISDNEKMKFRLYRPGQFYTN